MSHFRHLSEVNGAAFPFSISGDAVLAIRALRSQDYHKYFKHITDTDPLGN